MFCDFSNKDAPMKIEILGTPFNGLGSPSHRENPGDGLRRAHLVQQLADSGHSVTDLGDLIGLQFLNVRDPETGIMDYRTWVALSARLSKKVGEMIDRKAFPLLLGGDCSMLVGIMAAVAHNQPPVGLVFLDGHADFHSPETSPEGDPADMELAVLTGRGPHAITHVAGKYPLMEEDHIRVYGIRARDGIDQSPVRVYDRQQMAQRGIHAVVTEGLEDFIRKAMPVWLHFDVDVIDPSFMPVMFPEPDGLTVEETAEILQLVQAKGRSIGMSIACYHPELDAGGRAGARLVNLVVGALSSQS
jgi:arginase